MQNHCLALTTPSTCVTVHTGCPTGQPLGSTEIAIRERRAHPHWETLVGYGPRTRRGTALKAGVPYTIFQRSSGLQVRGGARRRRPGSRRSTSAWTAYVGADLLTAHGPQLPPSRAPRGLGSVVVVSLPGRRHQATSRNPTGGAPVGIKQASDVLPGQRRLRSSAGGLTGFGAHPGPAAWAARGCSPTSASSLSATSTAHPPLAPFDHPGPPLRRSGAGATSLARAGASDLFADTAGQIWPRPSSAPAGAALSAPSGLLGAGVATLILGNGSARAGAPLRPSLTFGLGAGSSAGGPSAVPGTQGSPSAGAGAPRCPQPLYGSRPTTNLGTTTTAVPPTPYLKPIGCGPQAESIDRDRTQSAHNRKEQP